MNINMRPFPILIAITLFLSACWTDSDEISFTGSSTTLQQKTLPVINEILFAPIQKKDDGLADQPDFVEIYNPGTEAVDLLGWYIQDCPTASGRRYSYYFADDQAADNLLAPGQYGIIVPEESLNPADSRLVHYYTYLTGDSSARIFIVKRKTFSLNNDVDCVTLKDSTGTVIDSVSYSSSWHNPYLKNTKGRSLEKFNDQLASCEPSSWSSCMESVFGGTPGKRNSIYLTENSLEQSPSLSVTPAILSLDAGSGDEKTVIRYNLPAGAYQIAARIYDSSGMTVRTLAEGLPAGPTGSFEWNGLNDNDSYALSGIYLVKVYVSGNSFNGMIELEQNVTLVR